MYIYLLKDLNVPFPTKRSSQLLSATTASDGPGGVEPPAYRAPIELSSSLSLSLVVVVVAVVVVNCC